MANPFSFGGLDVDPATGEVPAAPWVPQKRDRVARALAEGLGSWLSFPMDYARTRSAIDRGEIPEGAVRPGVTVEGVRGDLDQEAANWAAGTGVGMLGMGRFPGAAPEGVVGAGGGRLKMPVPEEDLMLALHNTKSEKLGKIDELGGFAVPSIAIAKPPHGFSNFGDISLVAPQSMVTPGRGNPVFASDVYSPRFPSLNDEGTKIFRGFTHMGNRRYAPLTMENLVREMKGNIRGGEGFNYGPGSIRSAVTPQFRNMREIQASRDKLVPRETMDEMKKATFDDLSNLSEAFRPYSKYQGNPFQHTEDFASMLSEYGFNTSRLKEHYKPDLPPELLKQTRDYLQRLHDMPTEYFEAKPQRAVRLREFAGAVVPADKMGDVAPILQSHGITRIEPYAGESWYSPGRTEALKKFRDLMFAVPAGGLAFGSLAPGEDIR